MIVAVYGVLFRLLLGIPIGRLVSDLLPAIACSLALLAAAVPLAGLLRSAGAPVPVLALAGRPGRRRRLRQRPAQLLPGRLERHRAADRAGRCRTGPGPCASGAWRCAAWGRPETVRHRRLRAQRRPRRRPGSGRADVRRARASRPRLPRHPRRRPGRARDPAAARRSTSRPATSRSTTRTGSVAVVLNGEIYNFRELRRRLEARGHRFRTEGDTEVIVHLYEEEGVDCVALAATACSPSRSGTQPRRRLLVARDRVGKKPLFYCPARRARSASPRSCGRCCRTTRSRATSTSRRSTATSPTATSRRRSAPSAAVRKLPPAHRSMVDEGGRVALERYWQLDYARKHDGRGPRASCTRAAARRCAGAVAPPPGRRRAARRLPLRRHRLHRGRRGDGAGDRREPVRTFSIGFDSERFDELDARARWSPSASAPSTTSSRCAPTRSRSLPQIARHYGEPFADSSAIPSFYLAEMTRRHVTVALNGDGGDESFAGYTRYAANALAGAARAACRCRCAASAPASRRALPESGEEQSARNRVRRLGGSLALDGPARYVRYVSLLRRRAAGARSTATSTGGAGRHRRRRRGDRRALARGLRRRPPRRAARRRRPHLPARRPADEDRHRDDGPLAGGALALARPRDDAVRGLDAGADEAAGHARRR